MNTYGDVINPRDRKANLQPLRRSLLPGLASEEEVPMLTMSVMLATIETRMIYIGRSRG